MKHQNGAALLTTSIILLFSMTIVALYSAQSSVIGHKIQGNQYRSEQAFQAADAAIDYGISYIDANRPTIVVDNNGDGFIDAYSDANTTNVVQANGSQYSVVYSNPIANNFDVIDVIATGLSDDGVASRTIWQTTMLRTTLQNMPPVPTISKGNIIMIGDSQVANMDTPNTLWAGQGVSFSGNSSKTVTTGNNPASSNAAGINGDVIQNDNYLDSMSPDDFFESFFGASRADVEAQANFVFNDLGNYSSSVDGLRNSLIWINQTTGEAQINNNVTLGSPDQPVVLVVNGALRINGNVTVYGVIYVVTELRTGNGHVDVHGSFISEGNTTITGNINVNYDLAVFDNTQKNIGKHVKVSGSWKDY